MENDGISSKIDHPRRADRIGGFKTLVSVSHRGNWARHRTLASRGDGLLFGKPAASKPAALFAGLLIVRVLLQLAQHATLLKFHVEALQRTIDGLVVLDDHIDQARHSSVKIYIMAYFLQT